ncbi:MAG: hypothetical protein CMG66_00730 [Candidatus Marinimicrobia bacterium]|nr:hypothetical protein [Candidatus Neomarinimicrobiota bacterium]|tara:strand:- start:3372 stop:6242 length:2871 start_codon:yes stop_codon:yes gene_type:complete
MSQKRELGAIVFTDITDFTSMMDKDESKALKIRYRQRNSIQSILKDFDGEYIKEIGDGDLMMFQSATDAVHFTLRLQNDIGPNDDYSMRAAIHIGDVVREGEDIFGSGVNMASRIHAFASPGSTVISESVFQEIKNKSDFSIVSIGKKNIKGIDDSIHIHEVSLKKMDIDENINEDDSYIEKTIMNDLFERRVPQFIGLYFAICWGIIQFVNWAVDRYLLSPHLVDLSLGIAASMLPSMLLLSYFHGRPGKDRWNRIEKIIVPANFIIATIVLFISFYPKDLGAVTKDVTAIDENGVEITKTIIKTEFRKTYNVHLFKNTSSDTTYNWMESGIQKLILEDLYQDIFCNSKTGRADYIKMGMGFKESDHLSIPEQQTIAKRTLSEYFIMGNYTVDNDTYSLTINLYKTDNAKLVTSNTYQGENLFTLIDLATNQIKIDMGIPPSYLENLDDLPIADTFTGSINALKYYTYGSLSANHSNQRSLYETAIKYDEAFVVAYIGLYANAVQNNDQESFKKYINLALKHINKLSDEDKFLVRMDLDLLDEKKSTKRDRDILMMWNDLYPDSIRPKLRLAEFMLLTEQNIEQAILYIKEVLDLAPERHEFRLKLGGLYAAQGDYDTALFHYKQYVNLNPKNPEGYKTIADQYLRQLDYKNAQSYLLKAQMMGAAGPKFESSLISINYKLNDWSKEKYIDELHLIVEKYKNESSAYMDIVQLYGEIIQVYHSMGKCRISIPVVEEFIEFANIGVPVFGKLFKINTMASYAELDDFDKAKEILLEMQKELSMPPWDAMAQIAELTYYAAVEDWDSFIENYDSGVENISSGSFAFMIFLAESLKGEYLESQEQYQSAVDLYNEIISKPLFMGEQAKAPIFLSLGRSYRELGMFKEAEEAFKTVLTLQDESAELFYEYSLLKEQQNNMDEALNFLLKAYDLYKDADKELELTQNILNRHQSFKEQLP